jgi:hypothetical protein
MNGIKKKLRKDPKIKHKSVIYGKENNPEVANKAGPSLAKHYAMPSIFYEQMPARHNVVKAYISRNPNYQ